MPPERASRLRGRVGLILFLAAAAVIWWGLDRAGQRADWLRVEGPRHAVAGQPLPMRVHLAPLSEPGYLCADLHWGTSRDTSMGYLATGGAKSVGKGGGTFDFEIMVPPGKEGLRFVMGVIYLGRTGNWGDHKLAVSTELIPVVGDTAAPKETRLEPLRLQLPGGGSQGHSRPAAIPRLLTCLLFLAAMIAAWGASQSTKAPNGGPSLRTPDPTAWIGVDQGNNVIPLTPSPSMNLGSTDGTLSPSEGERVPFRAGEGKSAGSLCFREAGCLGLGTRWWQVLVVVFALACLWELFGLESWLGARARAMARAEDLYYPRAVLQKVVISMAVAGTFLLLLFIRRARNSRRLLLISLTVYFAISAVNLVSLHTIDKVADLSWHGLTLVQALKLGCAAVILEGLRRARRA